MSASYESFEALVTELENYRARTRHSEDLMRRHFRARGYRTIPVGGGFTPGPDGVFWRTSPKGRTTVVLADNKAYSAAQVGRASALQQKSLAKNLGRVIATAKRRKDTPDAVIRALQGTLDWATGKRAARPTNVKRIVTNACGRSTNVSPALKALGIDFQRVTIPCQRHLKAKRPRRELELQSELESLETFLEL